jgi:ATP-dependent protease ClpP protease subunit
MKDLLKPEEVFIQSEEELRKDIAHLEWHSSVSDTIFEQLGQIDEEDRKSPLGLIRCSRGGKSRALCEIARHLKRNKPDIAVISISFNGDT